MIKSDFLKNADGFIQQVGELPNTSLNISTDTRSIKRGDVFIALEGPNFNGFHFTDKAIENGSIAVVFKASDENIAEYEKLHKLYPSVCFIQVKNTLIYMQDLARKHRQQWNGKVIGVTGSNGKTTNKEMLLHLLQKVHGEKVIATEENFNNFIGVPITLFRLRDEHELIIVEMGTSFPGEIKTLADIALPDAGFISNIGHAHIEFLKSQEGIFKEKSALYDVIMEYTEKKGIFLINDTDSFLSQLKQHENIIAAGKDFKYSKDSVEVNGVKLENKNLIGKHNFMNLGHMYLLACVVSPGHEESFANAACNFVPKKNRSSWIDHNSSKYFLDAYNANPDSMKASIDGFAEFLNSNNHSFDQALVVVGDMNELGDSAEGFHKDLGSHIAELGFKKAYFVGRYAKFYEQGFGNHGTCVQSVKEIEKTILDSYQFIFIKGSRSLQMESILDIN